MGTVINDKRSRFQRIHDRILRRRYAQYLYARATVPPQAIGVVLRHGMRWWFVTPGFPYEAGAWRVSYGDDRGPISHHSEDVFGRPFQTKYDAILDVLIHNAKARVTEYVMPSGEHVFLKRPQAGLPNPAVHRGKEKKP